MWVEVKTKNTFAFVCARAFTAKTWLKMALALAIELEIEKCCLIRVGAEISKSILVPTPSTRLRKSIRGALTHRSIHVLTADLARLSTTTDLMLVVVINYLCWMQRCDLPYYGNITLCHSQYGNITQEKLITTKNCPKVPKSFNQIKNLHQRGSRLHCLERNVWRWVRAQSASGEKPSKLRFRWSFSSISWEIFWLSTNITAPW